MNIHEDFIKKANKEIEKLTAGIEKKKARIAELKSEIKKHEAEKARDNDFSADLFINEKIKYAANEILTAYLSIDDTEIDSMKY